MDERGAKAAMYGLNRTGRHFGDLEEAWLVQALVREDGLSQVEVAALLGRHKSWVCRRLAMMEKLAPAAQEDLQLGLLSPTMARQLTRLPAGILAVQARPKTCWDRMAEEETSHLGDLLSDNPTPPRPATEYQHLMFEESEHDDDTEEKDNPGQEEGDEPSSEPS